MGAIIAEWSSRYLAEVAKHSEMRHYHPMSSLLIRFYIHNPNPKGPNINGEDAAKADLQVITNGGRLQYPPLAHMIGSNEKPDSRVIRKLLEKNEMILALGTKRGRTYGNINARPVLTDETIAAIVVKILEVNLGQYRWWDLYAPVFGMIKEIHTQGAKIADKHPEYIPILNQEPSKKTDIAYSMSSELIVKMLELYEVVVPILEKEGRTVSYASSKWNLANWPNYEGEEELEKWIDTVYSENWFTNSTSNIQRLLKISNEVITGNGSNGVKRGLWVHSKHIKELGTALNTNFDGVQRLSDDASKLIQSIDPEDPLGKHRLEQLSLELRYLSDEIDRRLK